MKYLNAILIFILFIAAFFVIKFSTLQMPSFLPSFVIDLFERPKNGSNSLEVLRILENLSLAYITSLIVYFLVDYIPKKRLQKKAFVICELQLVNLYLNMSRIIGPIKMIWNIKGQNKDITITDLKGITNYEPSLEKTYYKSEIQLSDIGSNGHTKGIFLFHKDVAHYASKIITIIDEIAILPSSSNLSLNLLNILSSIRSCKFIQRWRQNKIVPPNVSYGNHDMDNAFYEFIQLYLALDEYDFKKHRYIYKRIDDEEIVQMTDEMKLNYKEISNNLPDSELKMILNNIEYRIENGQLRM